MDLEGRRLRPLRGRDAALPHARPPLRDRRLRRDPLLPDEVRPGRLPPAEHIRRLRLSAKALGFDTLPFSEEELVEATKGTVAKNGFSECYIRPMIWLDAGGWNLNLDGGRPAIGIAAWEWKNYLGAAALERGVRANVSSYTRHHPNVSMTKAKISGNYVNSFLAKTESVRLGFDEAIMLDPERLRRRVHGREPLRRQGRPDRHDAVRAHPRGDHARHARRPREGARLRGPRADDDARPALHGRRGLRLRNGGRGRRDPGDRLPDDRLGVAGPVTLALQKLTTPPCAARMRARRSGARRCARARSAALSRPGPARPRPAALTRREPPRETREDGRGVPRADPRRPGLRRRGRDAARRRAAPLAPDRPHGPPQARGPAARPLVQAARRVQQDGAALARRAPRAASSRPRPATTRRASRSRRSASGAPATIVMPVTTPRIKVDAVKSRGARVVLTGDSYDEAYAEARRSPGPRSARSSTRTTTPTSSRGRARSGWRSCGSVRGASTRSSSRSAAAAWRRASRRT